MKNILYISSCDPEYSNGGAIGTRKIIETLNKMQEENQIKWYGVVNKEKENKNSGKYYKEIRRNKKKAYLSRMFGYAEQMELNVKLILKIIKEKNINLVIFQNSRLGNISEVIKNKFPEIKIIQNFDNFEHEFSKMFTKNMNLIIKKIEPLLVRKSEKKALKNMDLGIFLTEKDKKNVENFYGVYKKSEIIPFIYENTFSNKKIKKEKQVIFTGSLDMRANIEAGLFLIKNYKKFFEKEKIKLVLAGRNPNTELYNLVKEMKMENIEVVANPSKEEMEILLKKSLFYISPVFDGSGMKTKFVEAIFYGLPILASEHTMIGYSKEFEKENFIKVFKDEKDIKYICKKISELYSISQEENINEKIREFYKLNFSKDGIIKKIEGLIENI